MGWAHSYVWQMKIGRDILASEVPPEVQGGLSPTPDPEPRVPVPERDVPITSGCKKAVGIEVEGD